MIIANSRLTLISKTRTVMINETSIVTLIKNLTTVKIRIDTKDRPRMIKKIGTKLKNQKMIISRSRVIFINKRITTITLAINMMVGSTKKPTKAIIKLLIAIRIFKFKSNRRRSKMR